MPITKSRGNMYPWVTHTHSHLRGACTHACPYCYVQAIGRRFGGDAHAGPLRIENKELHVRYGAGRTYFIEHANDLFQKAIPPRWINMVLYHCRQWPDNTYVFQTRNTPRAAEWEHCLPPGSLLGTTIETNRKAPGKAPCPRTRARGLRRDLYNETILRFVTIEPVLDFDVDGMLELLRIAEPAFVNIGADSKGHGLHEPDAGKVLDLLDGIRALGIEIRQKTNLARILNTEGQTRGASRVV